MELDATGKVSLAHIYAQEDPRPYFETLGALDYCIPQLAKPYFTKLIEDYRESERVAVPTVVDVGCSYGINGALLRCEATIDELSERYAGSAGLGRSELVARDRAFVRSRREPGTEALRLVGLDRSEPALSYALEAGVLDDAVLADLESGSLTGEQQARLADADLVISTGCLGYVGERTVRQVADAAAAAADHGDRAGHARLPWMAHFVLRMFSYDPIAESLGELGYETEHIEGLFKQRRFASADEQARVLDTLSSTGVDPEGLEADGWMYAQLYLSLPPTRGEG